MSRVVRSTKRVLWGVSNVAVTLLMLYNVFTVGEAFSEGIGTCMSIAALWLPDMLPHKLSWCLITVPVFICAIVVMFLVPLWGILTGLGFMATFLTAKCIDPEFQEQELAAG